MSQSHFQFGFSQYFLGTYCVPECVPGEGVGREVTAIGKTAPDLKELPAEGVRTEVKMTLAHSCLRDLLLQWLQAELYS